MSFQIGVLGGFFAVNEWQVAGIWSCPVSYTHLDVYKRQVQEVLNEFEVRDADISLVDKGALDCVIRSRMQAVILRASGEQYDWSKEDALWKTA